MTRILAFDTSMSRPGVALIEIRNEVKRVMKSGLPTWKKQAYYDAYEFIREVREQRDSEDGDC